MEFHTILETIYKDHEKDQLVHQVGWWIKLWENLETEETIQEDQAWKKLQKSMRKFLQIWHKCYKKWEISSLTGLLDKLEKVPGNISQMSLPTTLAENVIQLFKAYVSLEQINETECLDIAQKTTIFTSSTTVPMQTNAADAPLEEKSSLLDVLNQLGQKANTSSSSQNPTGTMSSSISSCLNGENVKYGWTERVGPYRLTVSILVSNLITNYTS